MYCVGTGDVYVEVQWMRKEEVKDAKELEYKCRVTRLASWWTTTTR
jgi:hypothetical protein